MFGIELHEFISFFRQLGLAIAGAGSLWGLVFMYLGNRNKANPTGSFIMTWIGLRLQYLVYGGGIMAIMGWLGILMIGGVEAHEGITLITTKATLVAAAQTMTPVYIGLVVALLIGVVYKKMRLLTTRTGISIMYLATFILTFIAISYYTSFAGLDWNERIFHAFHGFHSIFTLGTVLTLDFMFLSSRASSLLQQHIFPLFPQISKVIWVGLSLDLLSVLLIYPDAVILSPRFFFAQTVVAILIINGVLLSGVLTRRILKLIEQGKHEVSKKWTLLASVAGTISVTSWMSITFVDFFPNLTLSYPQLLLVYISVIIILFIGHEIWERYDTEGRDMSFEETST
ncbi:MAG: hypothetical protein KBC22_00285 [Candidatus Pacebacteria bacterium]|nr:hypothetical protein [Candidatus Paceibacterota bacterium]